MEQSAQIGHKMEPIINYLIILKTQKKTQAASASSSDEETGAGPSQQQETPSNTLRRSSGSVLSPTPTVRGPRPSGSTWSGSAHVFTDPNTTRVRQQTARGGRGFSTLQQSWLTDFSWLRCEKDPDLMAQTADTHPTSHARSRTPLHDCFGFGGAGLRRLERRYALRCPLPSRRRSQASSAALYYVGHIRLPRVGEERQ